MNNLTADNYITKKEVNWSLLREGMTISIENIVSFSMADGKLLKKGEKRPIIILLNGKKYEAKLTNVDFDKKYERHADVLQIRYSPNSELAKALRGIFTSSYNYIKEARENREPGDRHQIKVPEDKKEYIVMYTTIFDDTYLVETISCYDMDTVRIKVKDMDEKVAEEAFSYELFDQLATIQEKESVRKVRKLNRKIGEGLKKHYKYRCQICGRAIGEEYGSRIADAHHIDYFVKSLNNDSSNQLVVCPNHHRIIHDRNPIFDRKHLIYKYQNGFKEGLKLNDHL